MCLFKRFDGICHDWLYPFSRLSAAVPALFKVVRTDRYLLYMTYFQGILAVFSVMFLLIFLRKQFQLRKWETVLIYLALILPYGIDTLWDAPRFVYTHYISTEGITYSLYYIFIACLLHFLLNQQRSGFFWCLIRTFRIYYIPLHFTYLCYRLYTHVYNHSVLFVSLYHSSLSY